MEMYNEDFVEREVNIRFNLSMQTTVDELKFNKGFEMHMVEFYECIGRLSEIASMPPVNVDEEDYDDWPYKRRFELPLHIKIEGFIKRIIQYAKLPK